MFTLLLTQYYSYFIMFMSAFASLLMEDIATVSYNKKMIKKVTKNENVNKSDLPEKKPNILISLILYIILCVITVLVYSCIRSKGLNDSILIIFKNMIVYYVKNNIIEFLIIPIITNILLLIIKNSYTSIVSRVIEIILAVVLLCVLMYSPFLVNVKKVSSMPLESEILNELRTMEFPYEARILDPVHFKKNIDNGYWTEDTPMDPEKQSEGNGTSQNQDNAPSTNIDRMNFEQLMDAVQYYVMHGTKEDILPYLNRAYEIYKERGADYIGNTNSIGSMFFYMGRYISINYFDDAIDFFLIDNEYWNIVLCYRNLYVNTNESIYAENIFSYTLKALEEGYKFDSYKYHVENTYIETFEDGYNPFSDYLKRLCEYDIDSPLLMTFNMVNSASDGTYLTQDVLKEYLNINKYKNCPKLMILNNVYLFRAGMPFSCEEIYELYKNHPDYFEEEDRVNLVWLLYENGEYIKTYTISKSVMNSDDESTDNVDEAQSSEIKNAEGSEEASEETTSTKELQISEEDEKEDQIDITAEEFKYTMLLIRAESYLQDSESLSEVDQNTLYRDITNALEELGFANTILDNVESNSDNEKETILIEDPIVARLKLAQCILAGRIGIDISYNGLSKICEQLFNTDSETGLYIVASLLYQDGNYEQAVDICEKILSTAKTKNDFQSRVLLLEADAWISLAEKADVEQVRMDCYGNAETILSAVRKMAQNDYIASSQRLVKLYEAMGRDDEAYEVEKEMAELLSNQYKVD